MTTRTHVSRILWYEAAGFVAIIALSWVNELSSLPYWAGGIELIPNWQESILETLIVLMVASVVMLVTARLVSRLYYLEGYLRVCAWCKNIEHDGDWIPIDQFFERRFETDTSHGMCPACSEIMKAKMNKQAGSSNLNSSD
jgi:hypothetical protein